MGGKKASPGEESMRCCFRGGSGVGAKRKLFLSCGGGGYYSKTGRDQVEGASDVSEKGTNVEPLSLVKKTPFQGSLSEREGRRSWWLFFGQLGFFCARPPLRSQRKSLFFLLKKKGSSFSEKKKKWSEKNLLPSSLGWFFG